jgi:hypothetical protein
MVAILRLIWGLFSRFGAWILPIASSLTGLLVASAAARFVAVAAAITAFVLWMPMPSWLDAVPGLVGAIPSSVVFAMSYARVGEGVAIVVSALALRFVARLVLKALAG